MSETLEKSPVKFTENAIKELKRLQKENPEKLLSIGVKGGGCTGLTYVLDFEEAQDGTANYEYDEISYQMKKAHGIYLQDVTIDFGHGLDARGFTFQNPNASETCGCGQSFAV